MADASRAEFEWALAMVLSRSVLRGEGGESGRGDKTSEGKGEADERVLLPLADMIRRGADPNVKREVSVDLCLLCTGGAGCLVL